MKKLQYTLIICILLSVPLMAENAYEKAMQQGIQELKQAENAGELKQVANHFERIATAEPAQWLPAYYAAYSRIRLGAIEQTDAQLDAAQEHLDKLLPAQENNSEVVALQGYLYMIRVALEPANRGPQLAPQAMQILNKAMVLDENNPRAMVLLAQMQYGTAQFFKSDFHDACELSRKAQEVFDQQESSTGLMPAWGAETAAYLIEACAEKYGK